MADFFAPGHVDFYAKLRKSQQFEFLGTCSVSPDLEIINLHEDLRCDTGGSAPWNKIECSEQHLLTVTLNRLKFSTYNKIRSGKSPVGVRKVHVGELVLNVHDFELFMRHTLAPPFTSLPVPSGAWGGRLYKSATLLKASEASPERVKEMTLLIECNPLYHNTNREYILYTEAPEDFPSVTPE